MLSSFQGRFAFGKAAPAGGASAPSNPFLLLSPPNGTDNLAINKNGTGGYPGNDDRVGWWRDDSSNGYHATSTDANRRAQYKSSAMTVNGNPAATNYFNDDIQSPYTACLFFGDYAPTPYVGLNSGGASVCYDFQLTSLPTTGSEFMLLSRLEAFDADYYNNGIIYSTDTFITNYPGYTSICWRFVYQNGVTGAAVGYAATLDTNRHRLVITYDGVDNTSPSSYTVRLDGAPVTPVSTGNFTASSNFSTLAADYGSNYGEFKGYIRSFAVYNRALTTAECEQWEEWVGPDL